MINPVGQAPRDTVVSPVEKVKPKEQAVQNTENNAGVTLELGSKPEEKVTYSKVNSGKIDAQKIEALKKQSEEALAPLRKMVEALLKEQGVNVNKAKGTESTDGEIKITPEIRAEAQKLVGEGGDYSAEKVSDRLVEFAKAISGGDKSKLDELRDSIKKGYEQAEKAFGGELPDISKQTLDMTMKKLDDWQNSKE